MQILAAQKNCYFLACFFGGIKKYEKELGFIA
jgi:hypothetical protein